jgi:Tol biopolymer transport system component
MLPSRLSLCAALAASLLAAGCRDSPFVPPDASRAPPLESVPYEALGAGKVLFQRSTDSGPWAVYLVDADARRTSVALEDFAGRWLGPALSPAGDAVAWLGRQAGHEAFDIFVGDLHGGSFRRLTDLEHNVASPPSWSPSGQRVVFAVTDLNSRVWGVFEHDLRTDMRTVLQHAWPFSPSSCGLVEPASVSVGGGIACLCGWNICASAAAGEPLTQRYSGERTRRPYPPVWSPAGDALAFVEVVWDQDGAILASSPRVMDLATDSVRTLAQLPGSGRILWGHTRNEFSVCWLPGGERLVFNAASTQRAAEDQIVRANLFVVGRDGSGLTRLTTEPTAFDHSVTCGR